MSSQRAHRRGSHPSAWIVTVVFCGLVAAWCLSLPFAGAAGSQARAAAETSGAQKVAVFEDVTIAAGETRDNVVVVGGDVVVHGTVDNVVVVVGGDVTVGADGRVGVGAGGSSDDAAIVCVFGNATIMPGGQVAGRTVNVGGATSSSIGAVVADPIMRPWDWGSIAGWLGSTVFIVIVALIATAVAPRQVAFVSERARRHALSSLGWGALGLIVIVPIITILLIITIIGILALVPWWIAIVVLLLFGYVSVGAMIGRFLIGRGDDRRGRVMLAAAIGVIILAVVRWIPIVGAIVVFIALLVGFGATFTGLWESRRRNRARKRELAAQPPGGPGGLGAPNAGYPFRPAGDYPSPGGSGAAPSGPGYASSPVAAASDTSRFPVGQPTEASAPPPAEPEGKQPPPVES